MEGAPPLGVRELEPITDLVTSMIERAPDKRPQHAEDVSRRLRAFLRAREVDLDEVARGLAKKVAHAVSTQRARAEGRSVPPPPMQRTLRPTPLAEGTRTFATRGDLASLPLDAPLGGTRKLALDETQPGTRKVETVEVAPADTGSSLPWIVAAIAFLLIGLGGVALLLMVRPGKPPPIAPMVTVPAPTTPTLVPSATVSTSATVSATVSASSPSAVTSAGGARLIVASSPPAAVEIDGKSHGQTPVSANLAPGEHRVVLRPRGLGERFERRVQLTPNGVVEVRGDFNDEPSVVVRKLK
jgi:hypothetical protein